MTCTIHADCQLSDDGVYCALYSELSVLSTSVTKFHLTNSMAEPCRKAIVNFEDAFDSAPSTVQSPALSDGTAASESDGTPGRTHSGAQKQTNLSLTFTSSSSAGSDLESDIAAGTVKKAGEVLPQEELAQIAFDLLHAFAFGPSTQVCDSQLLQQGLILLLHMRRPELK